MKKKILKWVGIALISPILLLVLLAFLLYLPPIQRFVVGKATAIASEKTGMEIHIDHLRLGFPLDLVLQDASAVSGRDTVLRVGELRVSVQMWPLLRKDVEVDKVELNNATVNTLGLISDTQIRGRVGHFYLNAHGMNLADEMAVVNRALLEDAEIDVALCDTAAEDTTPSAPLNWRIRIDDVQLRRTRFALHLPGDTLQVAATIADAAAKNGLVDLKDGLYMATRFEAKADSARYDMTYERPTAGLDYNHLKLSDVRLQADSISYHGSNLALLLNTCTMKEKSGLEISSLTSSIKMDSTSIHLPDLHLVTPDSKVEAQVDMDFNAFDGTDAGRIYARLMADVGKQDLMLFLGGMSTDFVKRYPNRPLVVRGLIDGNMKRLSFSGLDIRLESAFHLTANGRAWNLLSTDRLGADVTLDATTQDLNFVTGMASPDLMARLRVPQGLRLKGNISASGQQYGANVKLSAPRGYIDLQGRYNAATQAYQANLNVNGLQLHDFLPHDSLYLFTGTVKAEGSGTDVLSARSWSTIKANVEQFDYGQYNLGGIALDATLRNGKANVLLDSKNPLVTCIANVETRLDRKNTSATFSLDMQRADLYKLHLTEKPFYMTMQMHIDGATNLKNSYKAKGSISGITLVADTLTFHPKDINLNVSTTPDSTYAYISAGSMEIVADAVGGYELILKKLTRFSEKLMTQIEKRRLDENELKTCLPDMKLRIKAEEDNPLYNFMMMQGYTFKSFGLDVETSPTTGLNGITHLYTFNTGSMQIDTVRLEMTQDSTGMVLAGQVRNGKKNPQFVFDVALNGYLRQSGAGVNLVYTDDDGVAGVKLGIVAEAEANGFRLHFVPEHPVIAYRNFTLNKENYVYVGNDKRVETNIDLQADDGTGVKVYSTPNAEALQDVTVSVNHLNLGELMSVLPYAPRMSGFLHGDFHLIQTDKQLTISADANAQKLTYEQCPLGNVGVQAVYLPQEDGGHYVDAQVLQGGNEVLAFSGTYHNRDGGLLNANATLEHCPLSLINGFIPDQIIGFVGYADGNLSIKGRTSSPTINGELRPDSVHLLSALYGLDLRFEDTPMKVENGKLQLNEFNVYSKGDAPLKLTGSLDFSNLDRMRIDMAMRARNYTLIDAPRTAKSLIYGTVNVDFGARISGLLDHLSIRGGMRVLGSSDFTYILKDSPLSAEDRLSGLVTFVNFSDTLRTDNEPEAPPSTIDMMLTVNVEDAAQLNCELSADGSSYVNLEGGGNLTLKYSAMGEIQMIGRYTVNSGTLKYTLPVIPLKDFTVKSGSYIEFTGDPMNPTLNLSATERMKATVTEDDISRSVAFDVGVTITRTLNDMGLEFTLEAPEDMTVQNDLSSMSLEDRGKLAVTMLATGMYLGSGSSGKFSANNALNAFLQSEISNIAGTALKTVDVSVGVENGTSSTGGTRTDYSFKFAKRFWGNRVRIIVGGKVSTGDTRGDDGETFIDNVSLEYRLDKGATRYVRLFYNNDKYDILEGRVAETGGGLVLRKKVDRISELFIFRNKNKVPQSASTPKQTGEPKNEKESKPAETPEVAPATNELKKKES